MGTQILKMEDYVGQSYFCKKNVHSSVVCQSIRAIKANLTDGSMEHLINFVVAMAGSPEFLCRVNNQYLWGLQEAIGQEIDYRFGEEQVS